MTYAPMPLPGDDPLKAAADWLRQFEVLRNARCRVRMLGKTHVRVSADMSVADGVLLLRVLETKIKMLSEDAAAREQALK